MNRLIFSFLFALIVVTWTDLKAQLLDCYRKQVQPLKEQWIEFSFDEKVNELEHSSEPWQQTNYTAKGKVWCNVNDFLKSDTLSNGPRVYYSKTNLRNNELLFLDYGDKDLFPVTKYMSVSQIIKAARYNPSALIAHSVANKVQREKTIEKGAAVYTTKLNDTIVKLFIRTDDNLLTKITTLHHDELFGDALTTFHYSDFKKIGKLHYPTRVAIDKITDKIHDEVHILDAHLVADAPQILDRPDQYEMKELSEKPREIVVTKYDENIHFIELKHTDDRAMVVEFKTFLLVAEAPLNSQNGELIIAEAKKIAPTKPIKYFVFGHYHPHYIGGIRAFVHKDASVICTPADESYVRHIATAPHTLRPDSLELQKRPVTVTTITDSIKISENDFEMKIYHIGEKSQHTKDYLIYYFQKKRLLFEDDLVWIPREGEMRKAGARQSGLYHAIKDLGLNVDTIVQSWPVADYGVKTIIPFSDLEKSVMIK